MSAVRVHETFNLVIKSLKKKGSEMTVIGHNHIRKVETFDGYDIIAHPLPARDERLYYPTDPHNSSAAVNFASNYVPVATPTCTAQKRRHHQQLPHGRLRHVLTIYLPFFPRLTISSYTPLHV